MVTQELRNAGGLLMVEQPVESLKSADQVAERATHTHKQDAYTDTLEVSYTFTEVTFRTPALRLEQSQRGDRHIHTLRDRTLRK